MKKDSFSFQIFFLIKFPKVKKSLTSVEKRRNHICIHKKVHFAPSCFCFPFFFFAKNGNRIHYHVLHLYGLLRQIFIFEQDKEQRDKKKLQNVVVFVLLVFSVPHIIKGNPTYRI